MRNKMDEEEKKNTSKKATLTIGISDIHFGHENCFYETFWRVIEKLIKRIEKIKRDHDLQNVFIIFNGDIVSGTFVYRNQYLENQVQKDASIITGGAYLLHLVVEQIEKAVGCHVYVFMNRGNHEGWHSPHKENFTEQISSRLNQYGHDCRYSGNKMILNIAYGLDKMEEDYIICAFHSWGGADYSSASPSVIRELTRAHSQYAINKGFIIQRFMLGHTHWLEVDREVLGIKFDVLGGFQRWDKTISTRPSGIVYYILDEDGEFIVRKIEDRKTQWKEKDEQNLNRKNLAYVSQLINDSVEFEIKLGILKDKIEKLEL